MKQRGGPLKKSSLSIGGPKSEKIIGNVLPKAIMEQIMNEPIQRPTPGPDFPPDWLMTEDPECRNIVIWMNGENVTARCIAFEYLFTSRTPYWGGLCLLAKIRPLGEFDPEKPPALIDPTSLIYTYRRGIIVWDKVENPNATY